MNFECRHLVKPDGSGLIPWGHEGLSCSRSATGMSKPWKWGALRYFAVMVTSSLWISCLKWDQLAWIFCGIFHLVSMCFISPFDLLQCTLPATWLRRSITQRDNSSTFWKARHVSPWRRVVARTPPSLTQRQRWRARPRARNRPRAASALCVRMGVHVRGLSAHLSIPMASIQGPRNLTAQGSAKGVSQVDPSPTNLQDQRGDGRSQVWRMRAKTWGWTRMTRKAIQESSRWRRIRWRKWTFGSSWWTTAKMKLHLRMPSWPSRFTAKILSRRSWTSWRTLAFSLTSTTPWLSCAPMIGSVRWHRFDPATLPTTWMPTSTTVSPCEPDVLVCLVPTSPWLPHVPWRATWKLRSLHSMPTWVLWWSVGFPWLWAHGILVVEHRWTISCLFPGWCNGIEEDCISWIDFKKHGLDCGAH